MKIDYDKQANASYVSLKKGVIARTVQISDDVLIDIDASGEALGVEVLNVRGIHGAAVAEAQNAAALA